MTNKAIPAGFKLAPFTDFLAHVGPLYEKRFDGGAVVGFYAEQQHVNPAGMVHGGMLSTVIDVTLAFNAGIVCGNKFFVTMGLECQFLTAGRLGDWIEARGEVTRMTGSTAFTRGEIVRGDDILLTASGIMRSWDPKR